MKALVISGGGSKGAFAGGVAEYLIKDCRKDYNLYLGTSAGSLLVPLLSTGNIEKLHGIFTSVTQDDIFNAHPFRVGKKNGEYKTSISHWGMLRLFLKGKKTFGESENLRILIKRILTEQDFEQMRKNRADVVITVSNLSLMQVEYKSLKEYNYDDFCDWVWASCNVVPFMSLFTKNGCEYADGGLGNIVPIYHAIKMGATEIDVIVLKAEQAPVNNIPVNNALELTKRAFDFMLKQIEIDDILIGRMEGINNHVDLHIYRPPEALTANSLIFEASQMKKWWKLGKQYAKENYPEFHRIKANQE